MDFDSIDETLELAVRNLSKHQLMALASLYTESYITSFFDTIKQTIAIEAKNRVQSKIAIDFSSGYATGALYDSIYYVIEGNTIIVKSTKNYFTYLNAGFDSFDMKAALMKRGGPIPIRLPGGRVIFRWPGDSPAKQRRNQIMGPIRNKKFMTKKMSLRKNYTSKNWIHPGYRGQHILKQVSQEMSPWVKEYVSTQIWSLLSTIPDVPFRSTQQGFLYYNRRDNQGRFT
jgi:hypothetical protein